MESIKLYSLNILLFELERYDNATQSWSEGLLQNILLKQIIPQSQPQQQLTGSDTQSSVASTPNSPSFAMGASYTRNWIVFDGPLVGDWLVPIYSVSLQFFFISFLLVYFDDCSY